MVALAKLPVHMTVTEFLDWESGDGIRYELVDGEPRAMAPTSTVHAYLQSELGRLIGNHLRARDTECDLLANPGVIPHTLAAQNMRIPDLAVTCSPLWPSQPAIQKPVLIVEIPSPSNRTKTWTNVWAYTSIPGLQEILVLHTNKIAADLLQRGGDGAWPEDATRVTEGDLHLASIGFRMPLAQLYARTPLRA